LNVQEKLNAKYLGVFKTSAYELGFSYIDYLLEGGVLTEKGVSRMGEAQLASDLLVSLVGGVQTPKNIEKFYRDYENHETTPPNVSDAISLYRRSMQFIGAIYSTVELKNTNWSRPHWFYTLFNCVAHAQTPIVGLEGAPQPPLTQQTVQRWRGELDELSALYDKYVDESDEAAPPRFARFINHARFRTTDTESRRERARFVLETIAG